MTGVTIAIVAFYVTAGIVIGIRASRTSGTSGESYFLADRSVSWVHLALTLFATWMSTFAFIGSPGFYFKNGVGWFLPHAFLVVASPMLAWFLGRRIWQQGRQHGFVTPADLLAHHYRSDTIRVLTAVICLLALLPYCLIQLMGVGKVVSVVTDGSIPYSVAVCAAAATVAVYTLFGGIRAVIGTDVLQAVIFGAVMLLGAVAVVKASGGVAPGYEASTSLRPDAFVFNPKAAGAPLTLMVVWSFGYVLLPHMWQRYYMASSGSALARSIPIGSVLALVLIVVPSMLMGTLGIGLYGSALADSDAFMPRLFTDHALSVTPLLILGTFAAGMSTIDSQLLSAASIVTRDLVRPFRPTAPSPVFDRRIGRAVVVVLIVLATVLALSPAGKSGSIILLASKGTGLALLLLVPLVGALFAKSLTPAAGISVLIVGLVVDIALDFGLVEIQIPFSIGGPMIALALQIMLFAVLLAALTLKNRAVSRSVSLIGERT